MNGDVVISGDPDGVGPTLTVEGINSMMKKMAEAQQDLDNRFLVMHPDSYKMLKDGYNTMIDRAWHEFVGTPFASRTARKSRSTKSSSFTKKKRLKQIAAKSRRINRRKA